MKLSVNITFKNVLLLLLTITVLWLVYKTNNISPDNTVYMKYQDDGFTIIKTEYGAFPIIINEAKTGKDATEISFILINPLNVNFSDAKISVDVYNTVETVKMNLLSGKNDVKFKIPSITGDIPIKITMSLKRVYFK